MMFKTDPITRKRRLFRFCDHFLCSCKLIFVLFIPVYQRIPGFQVYAGNLLSGEQWPGIIQFRKLKGTFFIIQWRVYDFHPSLYSCHCSVAGVEQLSCHSRPAAGRLLQCPREPWWGHPDWQWHRRLTQQCQWQTSSLCCYKTSFCDHLLNQPAHILQWPLGISIYPILWGLNSVQNTNRTLQTVHCTLQMLNLWFKLKFWTKLKFIYKFCTSQSVGVMCSVINGFVENNSNIPVRRRKELFKKYPNKWAERLAIKG